MQKHWTPDDNTPLIRAEWAPIYLEPITHSGERITIGIALVTTDKEYTKVISTLHPGVIRCLFGNRQDEILHLSDLILTDINTHIGSRLNLEEWHPPLTGVYLGKVRKIKDTSIEKMLQKTVHATSSLGVTEQEEVARPESNLWTKTIKKMVSSIRPGLANNFERPLYSANGKKLTTIGYVGNNLAANFIQIKPVKNTTNAINQSIGRLIAINSFIKRETLQSSPDWTGLIIQNPPTELSLQQEKLITRHFDSIYEFASDIQVPIKQVDTTEQVVKLITEDA